MQTVNTLKWKVINMDTDTCILGVTGGKKEIDDALALLEKMYMDDFARTGVVAIERR